MMDIFEFVKFISDITLSLSAIFVAACALGATLYFSYKTHQHNKLSVKPLISVTTKTDLAKGYFELKLVNTGIGPAIIDKLTRRYNDIEFKTHVDFINHLAIEEKYLCKDENRIWGSAVNSKYGLAVKESIDIIKVEGWDEDEATKLFTKIKGTKIEIKYHTLYNEYNTHESSI